MSGLFGSYDKRIVKAFEKLGWDADFKDVHILLDQQWVEHSHNELWMALYEHQALEREKAGGKMTIKCYQVGGFVRDRLMNLKSKDLDYAVEAPDYESMLRWIQERGKVYLEQPEFWTVRAHLPGKLPADFVLCRRDGQYGDGRRPDSVSAGSLMDDLARRDFTVNAIAFDEETGQHIDPHGGKQDIDAKLLRCVGNARDRFHEDALRILRAIRFCITKGFMMHKDVEDCLHDRNLLERLTDTVSEERKREELHKCFSFNTPLTLFCLSSFPAVRDACFHSDGKLWLMPTMRDA